jgi:hypothetical protein
MASLEASIIGLAGGIRHPQLNTANSAVSVMENGTAAGIAVAPTNASGISSFEGGEATHSSALGPDVNRLRLSKSEWPTTPSYALRTK